MPKIRSIHPDACESDKLVALSDGAERTLWRLGTHSDDEGRGVDNPKLIAAKLYPLDDRKDADTIDGHLWELSDAGMVVRYEVDGKRYYEVHDFTDWQKPRHFTPSKLPPPSDGQVRTSDGGETYVGHESAGRTHGVGVGVGGGEGVEVEPSGGDAGASRNGHDSRPFTERCESYLAEQGIKLPPAEQELDHRQTILGCMLDEAEDAQKARQASIAIVADYLQFLTGKKLRGEARDHAWSLVGEFGGAEVLRSAYEAVRNAAGLDPKYHGDPLAVTKYMSAVLHGHGSREAS